MLDRVGPDQNLSRSRDINIQYPRLNQIESEQGSEILNQIKQEQGSETLSSSEDTKITANISIKVESDQTLSSRSPSGDSRNANTTTNVHFPKWNQVKSKQGSEILSKLVQVQAEQSSEQSSEMSQND